MDMTRLSDFRGELDYIEDNKKTTAEIATLSSSYKQNQTNLSFICTSKNKTETKTKIGSSPGHRFIEQNKRGF